MVTRHVYARLSLSRPVVTTYTAGFIILKLTLHMDCYLDVVGGLVPLRCEEGRPKAVRDKVAGKGQQQ
jgi:hypothetical protein